MISLNDRRPLGLTGFNVPPIVFGTAALANVPRIIPEQRKIAICGEWFRAVEGPVFLLVAYRDGDGMALEVLGRMLRRLDISAEEVVIHLTLDSNRIIEGWEKSCRLLGDEYRPKLVSIDGADERVVETLRQLKNSGTVAGIGVATKNWQALRSLTSPVDWVVLSGSFSIIHHGPDVIAFLENLAQRKIAIILSGVFAGGFLVGGDCLAGQIIDKNDLANRSLLAWRTAFVALCHGHGITPAHACIQFALSAPGVVAVKLDTSYPDRVAENVALVTTKVPTAFWDSMKEEGLIDNQYAFL